MKHTKRRVSHYPGIAKTEASWDDCVQVIELDWHDDGPLADAMRHGQVVTTAEFMRDAIDSLPIAVAAIDERLVRA